MRHDQAEARVVRPEWLQAAATRLLALLLLAPAFAQATAIFDGYEAYYVTRDGRLFREPGVDVASFFTDPGGHPNCPTEVAPEKWSS